jgi:hypothetical protein
MLKHCTILLAVLLLVSPAFAKDKKKNILPAYVLSAHTVAVIIDPHAGISAEDPRANQIARQDVEAALANWGRFDPIITSRNADLIIVVRKGNGRSIRETIPDARQNNRPGVITPSDNGVTIGGQHGPQTTTADNSGIDSGSSSGPQMEVGQTNDSFLVYEGGIDRPLDAPPAWRYMGKDGLQPHSVPAVAAFRQAIADAEKAATKKP